MTWQEAITNQARVISRLQGCTCPAPRVVIHGDPAEASSPDSPLPVQVIHEPRCPLHPGDEADFTDGGVHLMVKGRVKGRGAG